MGKIAPKLNLSVENTLSEEGGDMAVDLAFNSLEDFEPHRVIDQVEPLKKLMETRNKLRDLMGKVDRSEELESLVENLLQSNDSLAKLSEELGLGQDKEEE